jgi:hypothetical protein
MMQVVGFRVQFTVQGFAVALMAIRISVGAASLKQRLLNPEP